MMNTHPFFSSKQFVLMMAGLMGMSALAVDGILAAFPAMTDAFRLRDENHIHQIIFFYLLGFASTQIIFGFLSDALGRKKVLVLGILIYVFASAALTQVESFAWALVFRFMQGMGLSAPRVVCYAIVRDVCSGREMARIMSYISMIFIAVPIVAPTLGYWILHLGHWRILFVVYLLLGLLALLWLTLCLPETLNPKNRRLLSFSSLAHHLKRGLNHAPTRLYTFMTALLYSMLASYLGQAEQILQRDVYQLGSAFTYVFSLSAAGIIFSSYLNSRLVMIYGLQRLINLSLLLLLGNSLFFLLLCVIFQGKPPLFSFVMVMMLHFMLQSFAMTNLNALILEPHAKIAGTVAALSGTLMIVLGVAIAQFSTSFFNGTLYALSMNFAGCALALFMLNRLAHALYTRKSASD